MSNNNPYSRRKLYSSDMTRLMRRISALEVGGVDVNYIASYRMASGNIVAVGLQEPNIAHVTLIDGSDGSAIAGITQTISVQGDIFNPVRFDSFLDSSNRVWIFLRRTKTESVDAVSIQGYSGADLSDQGTIALYDGATFGVIGAIWSAIAEKLIAVAGVGAVVETGLDAESESLFLLRQVVDGFSTFAKPYVFEYSENTYGALSFRQSSSGNSVWATRYNLDGYVSEFQLALRSGEPFFGEIGGHYIDTDGFLYATFGVSTARKYIQKYNISTGALVEDEDLPEDDPPPSIFPTTITEGGSGTILCTYRDRVVILDKSDLSKIDTFFLKSFDATAWSAYKIAENGTTRLFESIGVYPEDGALTSAFQSPGSSGDPAINYTSTGADVHMDMLLSMRNRVELLAPNFTNPATSNPFNWTDASADNLYFVAMGDRTNYGATGGAKYDWTRDSTALAGSAPMDIDIGEIHECVSLLESL